MPKKNTQWESLSPAQRADLLLMHYRSEAVPGTTQRTGGRIEKRITLSNVVAHVMQEFPGATKPHVTAAHAILRKQKVLRDEGTGPTPRTYFVVMPSPNRAKASVSADAAAETPPTAEPPSAPKPGFDVALAALEDQVSGAKRILGDLETQLAELTTQVADQQQVVENLVRSKAAVEAESQQ